MHFSITDFDVAMTKELLSEIILKMEDNGFIIHGVSFDCGNSTLIKDCGMSQRGEFSFPNPKDPSRNVYLFPGMYIFLLNTYFIFSCNIDTFYYFGPLSY